MRSLSHTGSLARGQVYLYLLVSLRREEYTVCISLLLTIVSNILASQLDSIWLRYH